MSKQHTTHVVQRIYTSGLVRDVDEQLTLEQMEEFVGGPIECVGSALPRRSLIVNEFGAILDPPLPPNAEATKLVRPGTLLPPGGIRGNALVVRS